MEKINLDELNNEELLDFLGILEGMNDSLDEIEKEYTNE